MRSMLRLSFLAVMLSFQGPVLAVIVTQPAGLNPGDPYRLAFVTSGGRDAASVEIADYNSFVSNAANAVLALSDLETSWTAIASTASVSAIVNTSTPTATGGIPIYRLDGTKFVDDYADLWDGNVDVPLNLTELGSSYSDRVWTGADDFPLGDVVISAFGLAGSTNDQWRNSSFTHKSEVLPLYGLSAVLIVPTAVPEPSAFLCVGFVGLGLAGWKILNSE